MNIYTREMLNAPPSDEHIVDEIESRLIQDEVLAFYAGCASIAITNVLNFYQKSYLRTPTLFDMIKEAHHSLEETFDGGACGDKLLNFLNNEGLFHKVVSYPREIDLLEAVADPLRLGLLIIHIKGATHVQTIRQSKNARYLFGSVELNLNEVMNLIEEKQEYASPSGRIHHNPSVLIQITTKKRP